ncbi:MAG TPA: tetratricopeptide repeat protein [Casimicrobiaceae bacterium]|nr:tetratricopeptide repeat protein [Casimicrobiaceae bacterium]
MPALLPVLGLLASALEAQKAGRLSEALELYQSVVASQPDNFDACHMLGVVYYQRGDLELARRHVASAVRLRPLEAAARKNLLLIDMALERRPVEQDICREVLPRLVPRCVAPDSAEEDGRWQNADLDIVILKASIDVVWADVERLVCCFGSRAVTIWADSGPPQQTQTVFAVRTVELAAGAVPRRDNLIFFGADRSPGDWFASMTATKIGLYCSNETHCVLLDRIPELAGEGRASLRLFFASAAQARRIGLPGIVVGEAGNL